MAFPSSPTNGQQATVNGITYSYSSATKSWRRVASAGNLTANFGSFSGNVTANNYIISGTGIFYSNGTAYSSGGGATYTANTAPPTSGNVSGDQWYNTSTDILYEYQFDGTSYYWIDVTSPSIGNTGATSVLAIVAGGTGANTASDARTNLGLAIGTDVQAYDANIVKSNTTTTFTAVQTFRAANAIRSEAASTQDAVVIAGRAGGTSSYASTITPATLSGNRTVTIPDETMTIGFRNVPAVGTKTGSYTLATGDVGKYVQVGSGGSITIPDATFAEGDIVSIFNNTTGSITITCSITTAYISGTDTDKATMTLATRGIATVFFISSTVCVVSGSVT